MKRLGQCIQIDDPPALPVVSGDLLCSHARCDQRLVEGKALPTAQDNLLRLGVERGHLGPGKNLYAELGEPFLVPGDDLLRTELSCQKLPQHGPVVERLFLLVHDDDLGLCSPFPDDLCRSPSCDAPSQDDMPIHDVLPSLSFQVELTNFKPVSKHSFMAVGWFRMAPFSSTSPYTRVPAYSTSMASQK